MNKTYGLINRNGLHVEFVPVSGGFAVKCKGAHYSRTGSAKDGSVSFWDPEGGPFIAVGDNLKNLHMDLPDLIVDSIRHLASGGIFIRTTERERKTK